MLAGDVTVFEGSHLFIRGDAADNQFEIIAVGDELKVNGLNGTTINGRQSFTLQDTVATESGVMFEGGLRAHLGPGSDDLSVSGAQFGDASIIYGGTGHDNVDVVDSYFEGTTTIQTYDGDDSVNASGTMFDGDLFLFSLGGSDSIAINESTLNENSYIVAGDDNDTLVSSYNEYRGETNLVLSLDGDDTVHLKDPVVMEELGIYLGNGDDTINGDLTGASVDGTVRIAGQAGSDVAPEMYMGDVANNVVVGTLERRQVFDGGANLQSTDARGVYARYDVNTNDGGRYATPVVLDSTETISTIEWSGVYDHDLLSTGDPVPNYQFVVEIFEGAGDGAPESSSVVSFEVGDAEDINQTEIARGQARNHSGEVQYDYPIYGYSADVEYTMEAGKEYWVSIYIIVDSTSGDGLGWAWRADYSDENLEETVYRITWTPDDATNGDGDWRYGGEGDRSVDYYRGANVDLRLRT